MPARTAAGRCLDPAPVPGTIDIAALLDGLVVVDTDSLTDKKRKRYLEDASLAKSA